MIAPPTVPLDAYRVNNPGIHDVGMGSWLSKAIHNITGTSKKSSGEPSQEQINAAIAAQQLTQPQTVLGFTSQQIAVIGGFGALIYLLSRKGK